MQFCARVDGACRVFRERFDALRRECASINRLMIIGLRPLSTGRIVRIRALHGLMAYAKSLSDIWWTTREGAAAWCLAHHVGCIA